MKDRIGMGLGPLASAATLSLAMVIGTAVGAQAAVTAEQKCEAGKVDAAGKYAACLAKADKGLVLDGNTSKYDAAVAKCDAKMESTFAKLEAAAEKKDAECPSVDDVAPVEEYVAECVEGVAAAVGGGVLPTCDGGCGGAGLPATGQTECRAGEETDICAPGTPAAHDACEGADDNCNGTIDDACLEAMDDDYSTDEDTSLTVLAPGLLANDEHTGSATVLLVTQPSTGELVLEASGAFTYLPEPDFSGAVVFVYSATDGRLSSEATVEIAVLPEPDPPRIVSTPPSSAEVLVPFVYELTAFDPDPGSVLSFSLAEGPSGMVTLLEPGRADDDRRPGRDAGVERRFERGG